MLVLMLMAVLELTMMRWTRLLGDSLHFPPLETVILLGARIAS